MCMHLERNGQRRMHRCTGSRPRPRAGHADRGGGGVPLTFSLNIGKARQSGSSLEVCGSQSTSQPGSEFCQTQACHAGTHAPSAPAARAAMVLRSGHRAARGAALRSSVQAGACNTTPDPRGSDAQRRDAHRRRGCGTHAGAVGQDALAELRIAASVAEHGLSLEIGLFLFSEKNRLFFSEWL
jgi:hypothetical protein